MKYYYFSGDNHMDPISHSNIDLLESYGFSGALFTYGSYQDDYFTQVARHINQNKKIKYMIAIRPYTISPQYLTKISKSIETIAPNRLQINLISGQIQKEEKRLGGVLGPVNDLSSSIDRSNYMIQYLLELDKIQKNDPGLHKPDIFVSTTNKYIFETSNNINNKMIVPYREFKKNFDIKNNMLTIFDGVLDPIKTKIMIFISPVIRETKEEIDKIEKKYPIPDTEYFSYDSFINFIKTLESVGINHLMMYSNTQKEGINIINFIKTINSLGSSV